MRVITGTAKGRRLQTLDGLKTRPTSEIVKEAVFSIIQFEIPGASVLDLFAGSGQMGVEALSRGARSCVFVEQAKAARKIIEKNLSITGFSDIGMIVGMDAVNYVMSAGGRFDVAFVDPPYDENHYDNLLLPLSKIMSESGAIICESDNLKEMPQQAGAMVKHNDYRYGKTKITVYRQKSED